MKHKFFYMLFLPAFIGCLNIPVSADSINVDDGGNVSNNSVSYSFLGESFLTVRGGYRKFYRPSSACGSKNCQLELAPYAPEDLPL